MLGGYIGAGVGKIGPTLAPTPSGISAANISVASNGNPSTSGNSVTFTAAVAPVLSGGAIPTGTVTFYIDSQALAPVTLSNGLATIASVMTSTVNEVHTLVFPPTNSGTFNITARDNTGTPAVCGPITFTTSPATLASRILSAMLGAMPGGHPSDVPQVIVDYRSDPLNGIAISLRYNNGSNVNQTFSLATYSWLTGAGTIAISRYVIGGSGNHVIAAVYAGSGAYLGATSASMVQNVTASFTAPWQPTGSNVKTAFGAAYNLHGDGSTNDAVRLNNIYNNLATVPSGLTVQGVSATVSNGGTSGTYALNDVLTTAGETGTKTKWNVTGVSAGQVTTVSLNTAGSQTAIPAQPAATTGGGGAGCTLNIKYGIWSGTLLYFPAGTYSIAGGTGVNEVQQVFISSGAVGTFKLTFNDPGGTPITTGAITNSSTQATLNANVLAAINAALVADSQSSGLIGVTTDPNIYTDRYGVNLTFSGTGYTGLPQPLVTAGTFTGTVFGVLVNRLQSGGGVVVPPYMQTNMIGDVDSSGNPSSILKSTVANLTVFGTTGLSTALHARNMQFVASNTGGTGLYTFYPQIMTLTNCGFTGFIGADIPIPFVYALRTCTFTGPGGTVAGSVGLRSLYSSIGLADNVTITGFETGAMGSGVGFSVIRSTIQQCHVGLNIGNAAWGSALNCSAAYGNTFSNNDTDINLAYASQELLVNNTHIGGASAPSGASVQAILGSSFSCICHGMNVSGTYSGPVVNCASGQPNTSISFYADNLAANQFSMSANTSFYRTASPLPHVVANADDNTAWLAVRSPQTSANYINVTNNSITGTSIVGDGVTDCTTNWNLLIAASIAGTIPSNYYAPQGTYFCSGTLDYSGLPNSSIIGDGASNGGFVYGTQIRGNGTHPIVKYDFASQSGAGTFELRGLNVMNASTNAIYATNPILASIEQVQVQGSQAIKLVNPAMCSVRTVEASNNALGMIVSGGSGVAIDQFNAQGCTEAMRLSGLAHSLFTWRAEVTGSGSTGIALNLGVDQAGATAVLTGASIVSCYGEANNTGLVMNDCSGCFIGSADFLGTQNAPNGISEIGLLVTQTSNCTIALGSFAGAYNGWGIFLDAGASGLTLAGVAAGNGQPGSGAACTATWTPGGAITGFGAVTGSSGYTAAVAPLVRIVDPTGSGATAHCTYNSGTGVITGVVLDTGGSGYTNPTVIFQGTWATSPQVTGLTLVTALEEGTHNVAYTSFNFAPGYGFGAVTYALSSGTLPTGMTLSTGGVLSGTPTTAGTYAFVVGSTDSIGAKAANPCVLVVA
jgi:hypothetical protein